MAMAVDSADSDAEPTVNTVKGDEMPRVYGGMKPSKPNVRDQGKSGTVTNRMHQIQADSKQIFWRSQIEKQRALSAFWEGSLTEAAGGLYLPTNPIPASDLDLPPPLTIRSPSRARIIDYVGMYLRYKGKVNKVMAGYNVDTINSAGKERESFKITTRDYQWKFNYPMQGHCLWTQEDSLSQF